MAKKLLFESTNTFTTTLAWGRGGDADAGGYTRVHPARGRGTRIAKGVYRKKWEGRTEMTGWCMGASARWCHHMLCGGEPDFDPTGFRQATSDGGQTGSDGRQIGDGDRKESFATGALVFWFLRHGLKNPAIRIEQRLLPLLMRLSIRGTIRTNRGTIDAMFRSMVAHPGIYLFVAVDAHHVMAVGRYGRKIYFYDIMSMQDEFDAGDVPNPETKNKDDMRGGVWRFDHVSEAQKLIKDKYEKYTQWSAIQCVL